MKAYTCPRGRLLTLCAATLALTAGCDPPPVLPPPTPPPVVASAAEGDAANEAVPLGRLPNDVHPTHYALEIDVVPDQERFQGVVSIDVELSKPRRVIWLHGSDLEAKQVTVTPTGQGARGARYEQVHDDGVAKLTLGEPLQPGPATIRIAYEGAFSTRLNGLYRVKAGEDWYAFTQMEPVWSRQAFPCFNEPAFKTPWDVTLVGRSSDTFIANTREVQRNDLPDGRVKVRFATTEPLPSYLVAFAVGPLDVVEAKDIAPNAARKRPLPFRGVAAKGRGKEMAYALEHTPEILKVLEEYTGIGYPYDKLDIIAVPDKGGAMENAGAVTFREWLVLLDEKTAPIQQKRAFAYVMAHELAHQWFGDLVTMPWWDDIWLNEAFATWMGFRTVQTWRPDYHADVTMLEGVHRAMAADSLVSSRQIRQPVETNDDIHDAFDTITYRKGGGVLAMFERWITPEVFRQGLHDYLLAHRFENATADDLVAALSKAAGKDLAMPFHTFLMQPGLPQVDAKLSCEDNAATVELTQSRYLPIGSQGKRDMFWQIPVCIRYGSGSKSDEVCRLVFPGATVKLDGGCPEWIIPNADGAGYYQWSLPPKQLDALMTKGLSKLSVREKMSAASSIWYGYKRGTLSAEDAFKALEPLASDPHPLVATQPMSLLWQAREWFYGTKTQSAAADHGRKLYGPVLRRLGTKPRAGETPETALLRRDVLSYLALGAQDPAVRKQAKQLARAYLGIGKDGKLHPDAVSSDLAPIVVRVLGQDADAETFGALLKQLEATNEEDARSILIGGLTTVRNPELAKRARELLFDDRLKINESNAPLFSQLGQLETRDETWTWLKQNVDRIIEQLSPRRAGWLPSAASVFCNEKAAAETQALFGPRVDKLAGGKRSLASATESIRLCAARKKAQLDSLRNALGE